MVRGKSKIVSGKFTINGVEMPYGESTSRIVVKGVNPNDEISIDLAQFKATLEDVKIHRKERINSLNGKLKENYLMIVRVIGMVSNTETYGIIYEKIREVFPACDGGRFEHGTIEAYFYGCLVPTDLKDNASCSPVCAGALPPHPDTPGWEQCRYLVLIYNPQQHTFTPINNVDDKSKAIIYVPDGTPYNGFTAAEINSLNNMGVKSVKVIKYSSDGVHYSEQNATFVPVSDTTSNSSSSSSGWGLAVVIIVIAIILLALFVIVSMNRSTDI